MPLFSPINSSLTSGTDFSHAYICVHMNCNKDHAASACIPVRIFFADCQINIDASSEWGRNALEVIQGVHYYYSSDTDQFICVVGHDDAFGSSQESMEISLHRAATVAAALIELGVPSNRVLVSGRGEDDPLVTTPDGVREVANCYVEIRPNCR